MDLKTSDEKQILILIMKILSKFLFAAFSFKIENIYRYIQLARLTSKPLNFINKYIKNTKKNVDD